MSDTKEAREDREKSAAFYETMAAWKPQAPVYQFKSINADATMSEYGIGTAVKCPGCGRNICYGCPSEEQKGE